MKMSPRKDDMIPFPYNENVFFFCCRPSTCGQLCTNPKSDRSLSIMSERDTMFNQRDRRCTLYQLVLSSDPSYDNRPLPAPSIMQIWIATINTDVPRLMKQSFRLRLWYLLWFQVEGHIMPPHIFEVGLIDTNSVPGCAEECGDP